MKEFKRFCNFFFINKVIQVILVYTWICLSLPNGHIRATKMNIYILELDTPFSDQPMFAIVKTIQNMASLFTGMVILHQ